MPEHKLFPHTHVSKQVSKISSWRH